MPKTIFHCTVESDGESIRIMWKTGDNLTPAEALVGGIFRWHAKKAERTMLAVVGEADGIILA